MSMNRQQRRLERRHRTPEAQKAVAPARSTATATPSKVAVRPPGVTRLPVVGEVETGTILKMGGIAVAAIVLVAAIAFAVWRTAVGTPNPELDQSPQLAGQFFEHQGRLHLQLGQSFDGYNSNPPTSGPHAPNFPRFAIYNDPVSPTGPVTKEMLVHAMEHGAVVVWYNCTGCDATVETMKEIVREGLRNDRNLIMIPYPDMEPQTIAFTAWTRLDKFPVSEFTPARLHKFIRDHDRRFNPENVQ